MRISSTGLARTGRLASARGRKGGGGESRATIAKRENALRRYLTRDGGERRARPEEESVRPRGGDGDSLARSGSFVFRTGRLFSAPGMKGAAPPPPYRREMSMIRLVSGSDRFLRFLHADVLECTPAYGFYRFLSFFFIFGDIVMY